jgi:LmbE family N-acetylglucosaminyl deacetylase
MSDELSLWDADPGRVLAIVAHPDDLEYGAAAAVALWTSRGHEVVYVLATRGEAGIDGIPPAECGPLREREQVASARVVGVDVVEFLDHADGVIEAGHRLRRDLTAAIRRHRPDTLLLFNHRESWGFPGSRNSADHRAVGESALDAMADAGNRWIWTDLDLPPHAPRWALVAGSPQATHAVDVTGFADAAVASLKEHDAYLKGLGDHGMSDPEFVRGFLESAGVRAGVREAVAVEVFGS